MDAVNKMNEPGHAADQAADALSPVDFALLDDLRAIVAGPDRQRMAALEARIADVEHRTGDHEALVAAVSPILSDAIRRQVREDRDAMVESLYPLIGQLISRAVAESIRPGPHHRPPDAHVVQPGLPVAPRAGPRARRV